MQKRVNNDVSFLHSSASVHIADTLLRDASSTNEEESQHFGSNFTSTVVFKLTVPSVHHTITINMKLKKKVLWCTIIA